MSVFAPCPNPGCGGEIVVGVFDPIKVPKLDEDLNPVKGQYVTVKLQRHRVRTTHSVFDPTGLALSWCDHGLAEHPAGYRLSRGGRSWIRARYLTPLCPVCRGEDPPEDWLTPANA